MLTVILGVLKVIGHILLAILCIVLILILLLLFWPVRYSGSVVWKEDRKEAQIRVWWLLHAVHGKAAFRKRDGKNQGEGEVYLFGIPLLKTIRKRRQKKSGPAAGRRKAVSGDAGRHVPKGEKKTGRRAMPPGRQADGSARKKPTAEPGRWKYNPDPAKAGTGQGIKTTVFHRKRPGFLERLGARISAGIGKIKKAFRNLDELFGKISGWLSYLGSESFGNAKAGILHAVKNLLRHILPRRISGHIAYGMEDPAVTGEILAVIAIFYPVLPEGLTITPDFEHFDQNRLEADVRISGHIFIGYLLVQVMKLVFNKDFRALIERIKKQKGKSLRKGENKRHG